MWQKARNLVAGAALLMGLTGATARAGEVDVAVRAGTSLPFYEQSFPMAVDLPALPGVDLRQEGRLALDARGGMLVGAGLRWWPQRNVGIEVRYDSAAVDASAQEPVFYARVDLGALGTTPEVSLSPNTTVEIDRLTPISANLALRWKGRPSVVASAGVSYLPAMTFAVREELALDLVVLQWDLPALVAGGEIEGRIGGNLGLTVEVPLTRRVAFQAEGRVFVFQSEILDWRATQLAGAGPAEELVIDAVRDLLEPVEFTPGYFHLAGGLVVRF
jgi:hypothetical protein